MFTAKQKKLMNILGIVSDYDRSITYDAYCEVACEMSAEGGRAGSFAEYLEHKIAVAAYLAKRNANKTIKELA